MSGVVRRLVALAGAAGIVLTVAFATGAGLTLSATWDNGAFAQSSVRPPTGVAGDTSNKPVTIVPQPSDSDGWRDIRRGVQGFVSMPNAGAGVMIQSGGETWRNIRNGPVVTYGGWALAAVIGLLAVFYALRGRIRIDSGLSGRTIERFNDVERFGHWLLATTFIVLAVTGLNILFGRFIFLGEPYVGAPITPGQDTFAWFTNIGKSLHNWGAWGFMLGVIMIFVLWVRHNLPDRYDAKWVAMGGGMFVPGVHPPSRKFNFGQKFIFWSVVIGGIVLSVTGIILMFPFFLTDMAGMQLAQLVHAIAALVMIVIIIAHIYIGSLGMEGAFSAMGSGKVDENWAREHHSVWVAELKGEPAPGDEGAGHAQPAE